VGQDLPLEKQISIEGTLLMMDGSTPHVAVPVQVIQNGKVIGTTLSDAMGRYQFVDLKQEQYQVRCQVLGGYVYYGEDGRTFIDESKAASLQIKDGVTRGNIDFRFAPFKKGTWRTLTTLDGLAYNVVRDIYRDPDGVMWLATEVSGVSRYDGKEVVSLTLRDGLTSDRAICIHGDPDGTMWFGTAENGVSRYDGKEFVNLTVRDGLLNNWVLDIYRDPDGVMWFATAGGVSRYDGGKFTNFTMEDGLVGKAVYTIYRDRNGAMWFGTDGGVSQFDGKEFINFTTEDGLAHNRVTEIDGDPDGVLWFAGGASPGQGGVSRYDGKGFISFTTEDGLVGGYVPSICVDPDGIVWLGTESGVSRYDGETFVNFTPEDGTAITWIQSIHRDPDGILWFGSGATLRYARGGVSRYDSEGFVNFTMEDGLPSNIICAGHSDPDGTLWFGARRPVGVCRYDGRGMGDCPHFVSFSVKDGLACDNVGCIHRSPDGMMWFGTDNGVFRYDDGEFVNIPIVVDVPDSIYTERGRSANKGIFDICSDIDGALWFAFGFDAGVSRYDGKEFVNFNTEDGLAGGGTVLSAYPDPDGIMWFGTWDGGVSRYDGKSFVNFTTEDGLAGNSVRSIHRDPDGVMWFGTNGGLSRYDGKRFTNFTTEDGLASDQIWRSIYRDSDGNLWVGTDGGGASCYDGAVWVSLDTRDGLAGNTVSWIHQDSDGYMWFATEGGITRYRRNASPPKVCISSVTTDQIYSDLSAVPALTPGTRVTIEYNSIDLKTVPEKRQYRYRIYEAGVNEHTLSYLPPTKDTAFDWIPEKPGTYIFEIQAIDCGLNYSEPARLRLIVQPDPVLAELSYLRREVEQKYHFESIIGRSSGIKQVRALMERAVDSGLTVLITGETGTGKELVAKAIHFNSPRKAHPLMDRNCGAIPKELLAGDLFGHRKGAFTGAREDKAGLFEAASGGTVLLDEISEMPKDAQIHLLRVLEERKVRRLGENVSRDVDVRIIAMTNRDLAEEVKADRFREDLYYRLSVFPIHIPPLRERIEDISLLAEHFLQEIDKELSGLAPGVSEMLQSYTWPGNVRELRNVIQRAAALAEEGAYIQTYHFPPQITHGESLIQEVLSQQENYTDSVIRFRRRFIEEILRECNGNRSEAARRLGMDRSNLRKLMKNLGIE